MYLIYYGQWYQIIVVKSIDTTEHFFKFSRLSFMVSITSEIFKPLEIFVLYPYCVLSIIEYLFLKSTKRNKQLKVIN